MQQKPRQHQADSRPVVAKKRLGQNFLRDSSIARRIVASLDPQPEDCILEIGCGTGALTAHLAGRVKRFFGIELDSSLCDQLKASFAVPGAVFWNRDILTLDLAGLTQETLKPGQKIKVIGNLPYYISSPILEWLGRESQWLASATIMLQAEVAERLLARPGSKAYGVLTLMTEFHFSSRCLFLVKPGAFRPVPKVHSAVVQLIPKPLLNLDLNQREHFFDFIKRSFSQRRKTLVNCLKGLVDSQELEHCLARFGCAANIRAEALSLSQFLTLFQELQVPGGSHPQS